MAEQFASLDEFQRKRIEALNSLSSFVYGLKSQLGDQEGLGGRINDTDKKAILAAFKDTADELNIWRRNLAVSVPSYGYA